MTSLEYYIEEIEQFISMLTDDIKSGEGTIVTQTKLAVYREVLEHLEEIEQEPKFIAKADGTIEQVKNCDDCLFKKEWEKIGKLLSVVLEIQIDQEPKTGHCKDCKYFEYDSVAKVDGIPLIVAHEICSRWGDGCKTKEDGYCFMYEPQERSGEE